MTRRQLICTLFPYTTLFRSFKEVHRITKDGRFLIVNSSPVIVPRVGRKYSSKRYPIPYDLHTILDKQGWEFVDDIIWVKPDASVKNRIGGFKIGRASCRERV